ncbi:MAG: hypothetical protein E5Y86_02425 [Mesorhizobium sp.]|nr:MAG: hypothetical protein E5Y86_02425 [Mesorhizobium sp.]
MGPDSRAVQLLIEPPTRSKYLFLRNSGRKTAAHFSWNCSATPWPFPSAGTSGSCRLRSWGFRRRSPLSAS